jgi:hypothetical protein
MITPPKAETGSPAKASFHASGNYSRVATPQALVCLRIAKVGFVKFLIRQWLHPDQRYYCKKWLCREAAQNIIKLAIKMPR